MQGKDDKSELSERDRVDILLEEYRVLNRLLLFRLNAMDRRLPVSAGVVSVAFASLLTLPPDARAAVLIVIPSAVFWLVRTTVQHAKAKEDNLRRIDEIERSINSIFGVELLLFQSRHPAGIAAGRTGQATVLATVIGGVFTLVLCVFLFLKNVGFFPDLLYFGYVGAIALDSILSPFGLKGYRYRRHQLRL